MKIKKSLVIADLHIGLEHEIMKSGIRVRQADDLIERTRKLIRSTRAKELVILGDVKHNIPYLKREEEISVPRFLDAVSEMARVIIVPGNHDGSLKSLCPPGIEIAPSSGIIIGKTALLHGHASLSKESECASKIVIAHNHPLVRMQDKIGAKFFRQAWIKGPMKNGKELVIMPAFSKLVGGMIFNDIKKESDLLGPIAKKFSLKSAEAFLLDGTCLGRIKDLEEK